MKKTILLGLVAVAMMGSAFAKHPKMEPVKVGENETEFVFVGKCDSGAEYKMRAYKDGVTDKYDYSGPLGTGTIASGVSARDAKDHVCVENKRGEWKADVALGENDVEFLFVDKCSNGEKYRIFSYQKMVEGKMRDFFDFSGPIGSGTIRSNIPAKEAKRHVCMEKSA